MQRPQVSARTLCSHSWAFIGPGRKRLTIIRLLGALSHATDLLYEDIIENSIIQPFEKRGKDLWVKGEPIDIYTCCRIQGNTHHWALTKGPHKPGKRISQRNKALLTQKFWVQAIYTELLYASSRFRAVREKEQQSHPMGW